MIRSDAFRRAACCFAITMLTSQVQARRPASPLQPTTIEDWRAAGMDGTGCYWSARRNGPVFFAASGRTGVTKIAGRVVVLAPAPRSREMFPFTHDAWTSDRVALRVIADRRIVAKGIEPLNFCRRFDLLQRLKNGCLASFVRSHKDRLIGFHVEEACVTDAAVVLNTRGLQSHHQLPERPLVYLITVRLPTMSNIVGTVWIASEAVVA